MLCSLIRERKKDISSILKIESKIPLTLMKRMMLRLNERRLLDEYLPFLQAIKTAKILSEMKHTRRLKIRCEEVLGYGYLISKHPPVFIDILYFSQEDALMCRNLLLSKEKRIVLIDMEDDRQRFPFLGNREYLV